MWEENLMSDKDKETMENQDAELLLLKVWSENSDADWTCMMYVRGTSEEEKKHKKEQELNWL